MGSPREEGLTSTGPATSRGADQEEPGSIRSFVRGGALTFVGFCAGAALQFVFIVITTRGLIPSEAGGFFEATALVTILGQWGQLGVSTGFERLIPKSRVLGNAQDLRTILLAGLVPIALFGIVEVLCGLSLAPTLSRAIFDPRHRVSGLTYLRVLVPVAPIVSLTAALLSATRGWGTMRPYVTIQNLAIPLARPLLMGAALLAGPTALAVGLAWALPVGVGFLAALAVLIRLVASKPPVAAGRRPERKWTLVRSFWHFTAPRGVSAGFLVTVTWLDVLLVGSLRSPREAAIYTATSGLAVIGSYALQAVGLAIAPQFSLLLTKGDTEELCHLYQVSTWWMMALAWPFFLCLISYPQTILGLFGSGYPHGATALTILAVAGLINLGTGNVTILLLMAGRSGWGLANAAAALTINVGLDLLLIPRYGIAGAAVGWSASIIVNNVAALIEVAVLLRLLPFGAGYTRVALSVVAIFGLAGAVGRGLLGGSPGAAVAVTTAAVGCYVAALRRMRKPLQFGLILNSVRLRAAPLSGRGDAP